VKDCGKTVAISVKDTGIGIQEDKLEMIFERFKQVDNLLTRKNEGSGIGLSLVKSLVELHGGKISVKSEYNRGSEFTVELPRIWKTGKILQWMRRTEKKKTKTSSTMCI